jgi:hypothetical protein
VSEYNGHKSRAHWNVSLWLFNDEPLYRLVQEALSSTKTKDEAAKLLLTQLPDETPDGVRYTFDTVRAALVE